MRVSCFVWMIAAKTAAAGLLAASLVSSPAFAWDGTITGKISAIETAGGSNYGFRVTIDGTPACGTGSQTWVYMNTSYDNYQATASVLISSWVAGKTVTIFTNRIGTGCEIGFVSAVG